LDKFKILKPSFLGLFIRDVQAYTLPVQVAARSKAWDWGRSPAAIGGFESHREHGCLSWVLCVVRWRSLRRADHSSRGVLPTMVRRCVRSRDLVNEEAMAHWGLLCQKQSVYFVTA